jgi:hypothetical protein
MIVGFDITSHHVTGIIHFGHHPLAKVIVANALEAELHSTLPAKQLTTQILV